MSIEISKYIGRFSNNIIQMVYAIYLGEKTQSKVVLKHHDKVNIKALNKIIDFRPRNTMSRPPTKVINKPFYSPNDLIPHSRPTTNKFYEILSTYILPYLNNDLLPTKNDVEHLKDTTVIHIRSGDLFDSTKKVHPDYGQPPLQYYKMCITLEYWHHNRTKFVLVTEKDRKNPVIQALSDWVKSEHPTFDFVIQSNSFEEDVRTILASDTLICGYSTFTWVLMMMLPKKRVYTSNHPLFKFEEQLEVEIENCKSLPIEKLFIYEFDEYTPVVEWKNSPSQLTEMIEFPESHIKCVFNLKPS